MEHDYIVGAIPWPVAAATAIWFGVMAFKSGKNFVLWAIGGGVLGLALSTIVLGLAQAMFIPFYTAEIHVFRVKVALLAIVLVVCVGWLFTGSLHRRLLASWKEKKSAEQPHTEAPNKAPAAAPKP